MKKSIFIAILFFICICGYFVYSICFPQKIMKYHFAGDDTEAIHLIVRLNERVTGYAVSKTRTGCTLTVFLDERYSGEVVIGMSNDSNFSFVHDDQAHVGGEALLKVRNNKIEIEYTQENCF